MLVQTLAHPPRIETAVGLAFCTDCTLVRERMEGAAVNTSVFSTQTHFQVLFSVVSVPCFFNWFAARFLLLSSKSTRKTMPKPKEIESQAMTA